MARTPSMSTTEAESILGARGFLRVDANNRATVRKWLTAQGFPSLFVGALSMTELALAYNQTDGAGITKIRQKLEAIPLDEREESEPIYATDSTSPRAASYVPPSIEANALQPLTNGHANGHADHDIAAAIRAIAASVVPQASGVDADMVRDIIRTELPSLIPTTRIELVRPDASTHVIEGVQHPHFEKLLRACSARDASGYVPNIFIQGEASSGKTTACKHIAKALGLEWRFNGAISMPHEMLGFIDAGGTYHRTPFRDAYEHGGVYTFDEVDRSDSSALLAVNPHLANGMAQFPDGMIVRHKDCIIVGTANTWGLGADANYSGATKLDAAFMSRFSVRLNWDIDERLEREISGNAEWAMRVQRARDKARAAGLKVMIDVRMSIAGAALLAAGMDESTVAEMTYLANLKPEQRRIVES